MSTEPMRIASYVIHPKGAASDVKHLVRSRAIPFTTDLDALVASCVAVRGSGVAESYFAIASVDGASFSVHVSSSDGDSHSVDVQLFRADVPEIMAAVAHRWAQSGRAVGTWYVNVTRSGGGTRKRKPTRTKTAPTVQVEGLAVSR